MPHIALPENLPGITAGFSFRPETAKPMRELAHILLHTSGHPGFTSAERELIAAEIPAISVTQATVRQRRIYTEAMSRSSKLCAATSNRLPSRRR